MLEAAAMEIDSRSGRFALYTMENSLKQDTSEKSVPVTTSEKSVPVTTSEKSVPVTTSEKSVPVTTFEKSVPVSIRTEDQGCGSSSASFKVTENSEQNMEEVRTNLDLYRCLMKEDPNKSSARASQGIGEWFKNLFWSNDTSSYQETPKKTKAVVTLEDLTKPVEVPTIRVKLKIPAKDTKSVSTFGVEECFEGMFRKAGANLQLVQKPEKKALERNVKHLRAIFDSMKQGFRQKAEEFEMEFISLPLEQQKEALVYWEAVGDILGIVLNWLCEVFYVVLAKIREGYVIEKDVLNRIFKMGAEMLKDLYSQPMNKCIQ